MSVPYVGDQNQPGDDDEAQDDFNPDTFDEIDNGDEDTEGWPHFNDGGEV